MGHLPWLCKNLISLLNQALGLFQTSLVPRCNIIIIIIKLYLDSVKSGTAVPFTGVYTHDKTVLISSQLPRKTN